MHAIEPLVAPVKSGQRVGTVDVRLDDKSIAEFPLIALADVPTGGFFGRAWDSLRLWFGSGKSS
jgi:D-alanyl-D-alanine carboxypeptidase (penicillin-binding protein 5/6)